MITKAELINTISTLPENLTIEQIIEHLIFVEKINSAQNDVEMGSLFSLDQTKDRLEKWLM